MMDFEPLTRIPDDELVAVLLVTASHLRYSREQHERAIGTLQALGLLEEKATPKEVK